MYCMSPFDLYLNPRFPLNPDLSPYCKDDGLHPLSMDSGYTKTLSDIKGLLKDKKIQEIKLSLQSTTSFLADNTYNLKLSYRRSSSIIKDILENIKGDSETIGGFLIEHAGKILKNNEHLTIEGIKFIVESSDKRRIKMIKVVLPEQEAQ